MMRKWRYLNYAAQDQDPLGSYGEENLARLRAVSGKFDPRGMFQRNVPGGFKLVKAGGDGTTVGVA